MDDKAKLQVEFERWQEKMSMQDYELDFCIGLVRIVKRDENGEIVQTMANSEYHPIKAFTEALKTQNLIGV